MRPEITHPKIEGTWLDFVHPNYREPDYWNPTTKRFTAEDWAHKVREMVELGMKSLVLLSVAQQGRSFYPSRVIPERWELDCPDPLEALLAAADRFGAQVFVGLGFFSANHGSVEADAFELRCRTEVPPELHERYGHHPSFFGWYLPVEEGIDGHFSDSYIQYANQLSDNCHALAPGKPVMIAPYGTRRVIPDDRYVEQLRQLRVDIIAYQDEVGVRKTQVEELPGIFSNLRRVHDLAGKPLWADVEVFTFEGETYRSPLLPAPIERITAQLEAVAPYVEKLLCYQYLGMMNPPNSPAHAGHPSSVELYTAYRRWLTKG